MSDIEKTIPFGYPKGIGGHADTQDDQFDISDLAGHYRVFANSSPIRGGVGWFSKRRAIRGRVARPTTPIDFSGDRIAQSIIQHGVGIVTPAVPNTTAVKDILLAMFDDQTNNLQYALAIDKYTPSQYYAAANWGTWETCTELTAKSSTSFNIYAAPSLYGYSGLGQWKQSVLGHINMAMGNTGQKPEFAFPMKGLQINRDKDKPQYDGFFAEVNTAAAGGGVVEKTAYVVVPEKPWFPSRTNIGFSAHRVYPDYDSIYDGYPSPDWISAFGLRDRAFIQAGLCYHGNYKFWLLPEDENGELGPPIKSIDIDIPNKIGATYLRGAGIYLRLKTVTKDITDDLRPNVAGFQIFGSYTNTIPESSSWTDDGVKGYNLTAPPLDIPPSFIARIDSNGRQFDPSDTSAWSGVLWTAVHSGWFHSPRMNYQIAKTSDWIEATKHAVSNDLIYVDEGKMFPAQFQLPRELRIAADTSARVHIELEGRFGASQVTEIRHQRVNDTYGNKITWITLGDNVPGAWTSGKVRFVYPWIADGANDVRTGIYITDPETWDQSRPMPFPEDAEEDFNLWYPNYTRHFENPNGTRRKCYKVWRAGEIIEDVLYGTVPAIGVCAFPLETKIPGKITGGAYLTDTRWIVNTETSSYLGEDYQDSDGFWQQRLDEKELEYGHSGYDLLVYNRFIYGLDSKVGLWALTLDVARIRTDISPVGTQMLLMTKGQQAWFRTLVKDLSLEEWERVTIAVDDEKIIVAFPELTGAASGGSKNNISMRTAADNSSFWLTFYKTPQGMMLEYAFGVQTVSATITAFAVSGVVTEATTSAAHGLTSGDRVVLYNTTYYDGIDILITVTGANTFTFKKTFVATETGRFATQGNIPLFHINLGVANQIFGDTQIRFVNESDRDLDEVDRTDGANNYEIFMIVEPPRFRLNDFPGESKMQQFYPRLETLSSQLPDESGNAISSSIIVHPYRDDVAQLLVRKAGLTGSGWQRGIRALGDSWRVRFEDVSTGTPRLQEIRLLFKSFGSRRQK